MWSGCDRPFKPDTSSYDYDAPISEAGWATPKFFLTRELFSKYLLPGETLPSRPRPNPVVALRRCELNEAAPVFENLPSAIKDERRATWKPTIRATAAYCIARKFRRARPRR